MEQRRLAPYTSSPSQTTSELSLSYEPHRCESHGSATPESHHGSFDEHASFHGLPHGFTDVPAPREPENSFEPWLMDLPPSASPISTASSTLSPSVGSISTSYADASFPLYHLIEQPLSLCSSSSTSHPTWLNGAEASWQCHYAENDVWNNHGLPSPAWSGDGYGLPLPSMNSCIPPVNGNNLFVFSQHHMQGQHYLEGEAGPSTLSNPEDTDSSDGSDSESSDSENEENELNDGRRRDTGSSRQRGTRQKSPLVKVTKWEVQVDAYAQHETRNYICAFSKVPGEHGKRCNQKFVRPEHLRRHIKSVHGNKKEYFCKVPSCRKPFSRGDNLRDHYWTHLARGGRTGKNCKMPLLELKEILGPKERKLVRRLKHKLNLHKLNSHKLNLHKIRAKL